MLNDRCYDLIVVGGGAAGFFGALACAEVNTGRSILILEKGHSLLAKVRISGGGRCNVTHAQFDPALLVEAYPRGGSALRSAFSRFQPLDTIAWFEERGVSLKTEPDGRMFPVSDQSETIVQCLLSEAQRLGVMVKTQAAVTILERNPEKNGFRVGLRNGEHLQARRLLLATGGDRAMYAMVEKLGHSIQAPVPSLFTFKLEDPRLHGLAGVSVPDVHVCLPDSGLEQRGPLLITHWGVSGPAVLKLSAWGARVLNTAQYRAALQINWLPGYHTDSLYHALQAARSTRIRQRVSTSDPLEQLPQRLWKHLVQAARISENQAWGEVSKRDLRQLAEELVRGAFSIEGKGEFKEEFVTCGGVILDEINFKTMESRKCPGVYLAGELLDMDGITGGYNFQSAWTTGWLAGRAIAASLDVPGDR